MIGKVIKNSKADHKYAAEITSRVEGLIKENLQANSSYILRFYWRGGEIYVRERVRECVGCMHKSSRPWTVSISPLRPIPTIPKVFWRVHIDLFGPLTESLKGNKYGAIACDAFIKYVEGERINIFDTLFLTTNNSIEVILIIKAFIPSRK